MIYPAHIRAADNGSFEVQPVQEHCRSTAEIAKGCLQGIHLGEAGYLAGLLHDMGKFTVSFKTHLENSAAGKAVRPGSVIHTHGAARFFLEEFHNADAFSSFEDMTAELLAYASSAHHGLYDCVDQQHHSGFLHRLQWDEKLYREASKEFLEQCADKKELRARFAQAQQELRPVYEWANRQVNQDNTELYFHLGLLARLLLSSVIQGDRQDTAQFMNHISPPVLPEPGPVIWERLLQRVEKKLDALPAQTPVQRARREISCRCRKAGELNGGICQLHVPTGGGKTLSSLRYALAHAARHRKSRIVFTSPLLTILEQNAAVLREFLQEDDLILEHHSNVVQEKRGPDKLDPHELMAESWDAPIIVTTLVQLLDALFSGKTSCIRRFQALCNCVLVIDEVQTVPPRMMTLFNLALNFLANVCGATIILCSATQPCFDRAEHPILGTPEELVPYTPELWAPFKRTRLIDAGSRRLEEIPDFIREKLRETDSLLTVCNTKQQARFLCQQMKDSGGLSCFHLSAAMCPEHRRDTLAHIEQALNNSRKDGKKVLCIATQLIESGVDISFGCVIRLAAGMDNAVQAAGRCNRNGESPVPSPVFLLNCSDENLGMLPEIQAAKTASLQLLSAFHEHPEEFGSDLSSPQCISRYYQNLYDAMPSGAQNYPTGDRTTLFDLLSVNDKYAAGQPGFERFGLRQAFALAGRQFQVFSQETTDILVPYGEGEALIAELCASRTRYEPGLQKELLDRAKPFAISVYRFQREQLERQGGLMSLLDGTILALDPAFYDAETGLTPEPGSDRYLEV